MSAQHQSKTALSPAEHIVVVDDQDDIAEGLAEVLALDGFAVRTARDGASALDAIAEHAPICVLTDVNMPGIDGFELARRLRARYGSDIVLIAVTGWGMRDDRTDPAFEDFDHCLRKTIDLDQLRRILRFDPSVEPE
jgi:CheY-like chemotaxis protein